MYKYNHKILIVLFSLVTFCISARSVYAVYLEMKPSSDIVGLYEQFYVDVYLNAEGETYNGIEGKIVFPSDKLSFIRSEDGKSMVDLWIKNPSEEIKGEIDFAGLMSYGFSGVIDPFNPKVKLGGPIIRLVFEAKNPIDKGYLTSNMQVTIADGLGSVVEIPQKSISITVQHTENPYTYKSESKLSPSIDAYVTRDINLYDNKYTLIFQAYDKGSGIKDVMVREGNGDWKKVESPYLLEDQSRHSIIYVRAVNNNGISYITSIDALPYNKYLFYVIGFIFIVLILIILKKKFHKNKKHV